jgi:uncharacterized glyoxalase superfamily protein PhnB
MPPLSFTCECLLPHPSSHVYFAWTAGWGLWFAEANSVRLSPQVGAPFFFEVAAPAVGEAPPTRHAHYGRFLALEPESLMRCTWVTGPLGTEGVETVLTVRLVREGNSHTRCTLTHEGFGTAAARDRHAMGWPLVLEALGQRLAETAGDTWATLARSTDEHQSRNRSMPDATLIPTRSYPDVEAAVRWLHDVLGCEERLRVPGERVQLTVGNGAVVVAAWDPASAPATGGRPPATLLIRVANVDDAYARALASGASGLSAPIDYPFGERQATVRDPAGHAWTLSHTVADVDPSDWGGALVDQPATAVRS